MIIGAQKSGTTTLSRHLESHPEVSFCSIKEPGFFNATPNWSERIDEYHALYPPSQGTVIGEASTMYTFLPESCGTASRIHQYNPDLKLIYIMRNPIERAVSQYAHRISRGRTSIPPEIELFRDPSYINRSRYLVQLRPYIRLFPRENLLLLVFEDFIVAPDQALQQVAAFLGISPEPFVSLATSEAHNVSAGSYRWGKRMSLFRSSATGKVLRAFVPEQLRSIARRTAGHGVKTKPQVSPEVKKLLSEFLSDDIAGIEALLGRPIPQWHSYE